MKERHLKGQPKLNGTQLFKDHNRGTNYGLEREFGLVLHAHLTKKNRRDRIWYKINKILKFEEYPLFH